MSHTKAVSRCARWASFLFFLALSACSASSAKPPSPYCTLQLRRVDFQGVRSISKSELRDALVVRSKSWKFWLKEKNCVDSVSQFTFAAQQIQQFYVQRGFYNAQVSFQRKRISEGSGADKAPVEDVLFVVEEGKPATLAALVWEGTEQLPGQERAALTKAFDIQLGSSPSYLFVSESAGKIKDWLQRRAYAFAEVRFLLEPNTDTNTLRVTYTLHPGQKTVFGKTTVTGAKHMSPQSVALHAAISPGEPFHPNRLNAAGAKLSNSNVFSNLEVTAVAPKDDPQKADVNIVVTEAKPQDLQLGLGLAIEPQRTESYLRLFYNHRNFFGELRSLRLGAQLGYAAVPAYWSSEIQKHGLTGNLQAFFTQPDLFGRDSALQAGLQYQLGLDYAFKYHGPEVSLELQKAFWWRRIQLSLSYHFKFFDFFETDPSIQDILQNDPVRAGSLFGYTDPYRLAYFRESVALDLRNRPVDPVRGIYLGIQFEHGGIYTGGAFDYQKMTPEFRGYLPLGNRVVLAARATFGQIFAQGSLGSPITQRYYLGGPNSHRGFSYNRLSYQICSGSPSNTGTGTAASACPLDDAGSYQRIPIGGDQMFLAQFETRVRLFELFKNWLSAVAFVDAGDVARPKNCDTTFCSADSYETIDFSRLHWAAGAGLRYQTIVGALGITLGVRLNRLAPSDNGIQNPDPSGRPLGSIAFHVSIGESF